MKKLFVFILALLLMATPACAEWSTGGTGGGSVSDETYGAGWNGVTAVAPSKNAIYDKIEGMAGGHDPFSLGANITSWFDLATQEITLDLQTANCVFAGPASGADAAPTCRSLVDNDVPDTISISNLTQIATRSHTSLTDIGTNTHAQIDTHLGSTANPHSVTATQIGLGNVENTALSTWAGSSNMVTLGVVGTGTWQGDAIADAYVADNISLTNITQIGTRPVTSLTGGNWKVFYTNGSGTPVELALGANGTFLRSNGPSAIPTFGSPSGSGDMLKSVYDSNDDGVIADAQVANDISITSITQITNRAITSVTAGNWKMFYSNGSGVITELPNGADGNLLKAGGASGPPAWTDTLSISKITDTVPFADDGDSTKKMNFQLSGIGTGTTRTTYAVNTDMRIPAATQIATDGTLAANSVLAADVAAVLSTDGACISIGNWSDAISTGTVWSQAFRVPFKHTLTKVVLTTNQTSGAITIDIWTDAAGATNGLTAISDADSLFDTASEPLIADASSDAYVEVTSFDSGEATNNAGDWYAVNVDSASTLTGANVCFEFARVD